MSHMGTKLRIAVWYNLPTGGARRALHDHIRGLTERGHEVECFRPPIPNPEWLKIPCVEHEIALKQVGGDHSYLGRIVKHVVRLTAGIKAMEDHSQKVAQLIDQQGFDLLFANTCYQYYAPFVGRYCQTPSLLYLQEPNRFLYEALPYLPWLGAPAGSSWRRRLRARFDIVALRNEARHELANAKSYRRILVNSYYSRESVARAYGLDSEVCYLGVDTDHYSLSTLPRESFVLGVGAIANTKRVELAIEAVGTISAARPKLIWAANSVDGAYLTSLEARAKQIGVDFEVRHLVPEDELLSLLHRATCVIYTPRLEPFGYVPLEAAACGTPVVTVAEGGLRETMMNGLGWIADATPEALGKRIKEILQSPAECAASTAARRPEIVKQWNLPAAIDRLEPHLLDIAGKG